MPAPLTTEMRDGLAVVRMDDGKANAFSFAMLEALDAALDAAERDAKALVLLGRPERFSGGFDLGVMNAGGEATIRLVTAGGRLALRLYEFPLPVVIGCTGHALAMGAVALCAADLRIGAAGAYKIGLNEVAIGLTLPPFAIELARARLAPTHLQRATALAEVFDPTNAVAAGFLDRVVAPAEVEKTTFEAAAALAALPARAHAGTKRALRRAALDAIRSSLV